MELLLCILGWLVYQLFMLNKEKNIIDDTDETFSFKKYTEDNWDDWLFTLIAAIGLFLIAPDIFLLVALNFTFMENVFWSTKIPFFIGAFAGLIFQGLYDLVKLGINKIKNKIK